MSTKDWVSEIREREQAATEGPWKNELDADIPDDVRVCYMKDGSHCEWCIAISGATINEECVTWTPETLARWHGDAAFIAHARTDIPSLLRVVETADKLAKAVGEGCYCERCEDFGIVSGSKCKIDPVLTEYLLARQGDSK